MGEKGMWLNSTAAPATVIDDKPLITTSKKRRKVKVRMILKPGDLPKLLKTSFGGKVVVVLCAIRLLISK